MARRFCSTFGHPTVGSVGVVGDLKACTCPVVVEHQTVGKSSAYVSTAFHFISKFTEADETIGMAQTFALFTFHFAFSY
jgi:hypothetical protein